MTGSVPLAQTYSHPLLRFAADGANFSVNSDDPTITQTRISDEFEVVRSWGLTEAHLVRAVSRRENCVIINYSQSSFQSFNAARSSVLPESEKRDLIRELKKAYGILDD